jgi:hypothetical protein
VASANMLPLLHMRVGRRASVQTRFAASVPYRSTPQVVMRQFTKWRNGDEAIVVLCSGICNLLCHQPLVFGLWLRIQGRVEPGDIVLVFTDYMPPQTDDAIPEVRTLTHEAVEFLATLPVRAYGTDAFGVETNRDLKMPWIHHSLLSHGIPVYEQLLNLRSCHRSARLKPGVDSRIDSTESNYSKISWSQARCASQCAPASAGRFLRCHETRR